MPVVFRSDGLRYFFFSNEGSPREPPHIHVKGGGCDAKIWLEPDVSIAESHGFNSGQLRHILQTVVQNKNLILRDWNEYFSNSSKI